MTQKVVAPSKDRFVFLDYLRIIATFGVVWDHVVALWPEGYGFHLKIVSVSRTYIAEPFGIIQDFGWLSVSLFFLVSGFIITHVATRESTAEFLVKRFFRIFPLLAVFVVLATVLNPDVRAQIGIADLLRNMTLLNYMRTPQVVTVGVAWTLVIEIQFYLLTALTMWTRRHDVPLAINLLVPLVVIAVSRKFGADFFLFAGSMAYVPYLVVGQIFYLGLYRKVISLQMMMVSLLVCFAVIIYGLESIHTNFLPVTQSYLINFVYACCIFCVFFRLNRGLKSGLVVRFLAATSFAVYLVHGVIGRVVFDPVAVNWGVRSAVMAALGVTAVCAVVVHFTLEKRFLAAGHRLARRFALHSSLRLTDQQISETRTLVIANSD